MRDCRARARVLERFPRIVVAVCGLLLLSAVVALSWSAGAAAAAQLAPLAAAPGGPAVALGPKIEFDTQFVDFGKVYIDRLAPYAFVYRNVGDAELRITNEFGRDQKIQMKVLEGC
ncbi:MAG: hypothetical protein HYY96_12490 [Candidatus Tectomicrobia bacterium]|nr:hypothetical protein [Candidatus Tectomicrobia bacterium]